MQLITDCIPLLLFSDPKAVPSASPWSLCEHGSLGKHGSQCDGREALFGRFQLPEGPRRCAIFLVQEKVMQGTSRSADSRAYRRIAPKSLELVLVSKSVALAFCGRLLVQQPAEVEYFDPERDWPKPIVFHASFSVVMEEMASLVTHEADVNCWFSHRQIRHDSADDGHLATQHPSAKNDE